MSKKSLFFVLIFFSFFSLNKLPFNFSYIIAFPFVVLALLEARKSIFSLGLAFFILIFGLCFSFGIYLFQNQFLDKEVVIFSSALFLYSILIGIAVVEARR